MRRLAVITASIVVACVPAAPPEPAPSPAPAPTTPTRVTGPITVDDLRRDLFIFASGSFRGREAGTSGERMAVDFLVERLRQLGVEPAGDSGYVQRVPLFRQTFGPGTSLRVTGSPGTTNIPIGRGLMPLLQLGPGAEPRLSASGDLVFAGYGVALPNLGRNDLANLDVTGKVVVVVNGAPPEADSAQRELLVSQQALGQRLQQFAAMQPAAIILLLTGEFGREFEETYVPSLMSQMSPTPMSATPDSARRLPMILLGRLPPRDSPLLPAGWPNDDRAQPLTGRRFDGRVQLLQDTVSTFNVLGRIPGSDRAFANSYVAFGAHLDHIGIQAAVNGDSIANGADDDGSGSIGLLAVARTIQQMQTRPRRSTLLIWHTAEEKGLFGSAHFVANPTVPVDSIVAMINADMIGRNHPDSLYIVGPAAAPNNQSRVLGAIVDSVNAALPRPFRFNREWDDPAHPEQIYYRSDHYNYATRGVPVVFFTSGLHDDYHKVSDEPDKIDFTKMQRVAELFVELAEAVGNRRTRPR